MHSCNSSKTSDGNHDGEQRGISALFFVGKNMAKEFAGNFYKTAAWVSVRNAYMKRAGYLCEKCLEKGLIRPGEIVHHKIFLDEKNIKDPQITLNMDNLQLLCRECHADVHEKQEGRRYKVMADGLVKVL